MTYTILVIQWDFAISLSIIGYVIVLLALLFLFVIYTIVPKILGFVTDYYRRKKQNGSGQPVNIPESGEISAAISTALFLFLNEQHDTESGKMTIKEVSKKYSPWSSKIYGLRQPLKK